MTTFKELLETQLELQTAVGAWPKTLDDLLAAMIEEAGEVSRERRADWRWWSWKTGNKSIVDRQYLAEEMADVLHFFLIGVLRWKCLQTDGSLSDYANLSYSWQKFEPLGLSDGPSGAITEFLAQVTMGWWNQALDDFIDACYLLEIPRAELVSAYLEKVEKNKARLCPTDGCAEPVEPDEAQCGECDRADIDISGLHIDIGGLEAFNGD
ncbi:MAG: dUTP diphosphatase [Cyanobacteria bacterium J06554_11]